ncbi:hypothetical protein, partial [Acinetobacter baumannii]|uniref:hypothetical protein n=1 Tax=Acinetobacter baumannii TaxID=470 RepID=UPI00332F2ADD
RIKTNSSEVLKLGDQSYSPTDYPADRIIPILTRMGYEGSYPPLKKKFLPPYWRFLVHAIHCCISGKKSGSDEIFKTETSAVIALTMDWEFIL